MKSLTQQLKVKDRLLSAYTIAVVFPVIYIGTNFSLVMFIFLWQYIHNITKVSFSSVRLESKLLMAFGVGVVISIFDIWTLEQGTGRITKAFAVVPNYLYWALTIVLFVTNYRLINFSVIYKSVTISIVCVIAYYYVPFFKPLEATFLFRGLPDNIFAFILIGFTPITLSYIKNKFGIFAFFISGISLMLFAFLGGSRSGSLLVSLNFAILTIFYLRNSLLIYFSFAIGAILFLSYLSFEDDIKQMVKALNPRTYDLLYEENTLELDHSYLTRVAIREKGLSLFEKSPITGVGINNFGSLEGEISYNFVGGDIVARDDEHIQHASAHNSYISILTETGLLGSIPLAIFILYSLSRCLRMGLKGDEQSFVLAIGLIGMLIHFNFISAILNIYTWFYFGLVAANNQRFNQKNETRNTLSHTAASGR